MALFPDHSGIANLRTSFRWIEFGDVTLPLTINDGRQATCYICCPTAAYIEYAREELRNLKQSALLFQLFDWLISAAAPLVRATRFDRQVQPNNWLLATNILCTPDREIVGTVTDRLLAEYPDHAIVWRSLNESSDAEALQRLKQAGYKAYAARQVYLYDCRDAPPRIGRDLKRDLLLLEDGEYGVVHHDELSERDDETIASLYGQLYLEKYTPLNPQYLRSFIRSARLERGIVFTGLRDREGSLAAVIGVFQKGEIMTAPIVGYDTTRPQALGLYRRLMALSLLKARNEGLLYNMSAGASGFKRARGARPAIEYNMIYNRHLPVISRLAAWQMRAILDLAGVPLMKRRKL